jgi:uncharacterized glyoxalase superfamily metalloenzyme YdcJ
MANTITADDIREQFSQAMSAMYQQEVPQYGTLLELVADVNLAVLENNPRLHEQLANADELARLNVERHGRSALARRMSCLRRMFAIMGMFRSAITICLRRAYRSTPRLFPRLMMRRWRVIRFVSLPRCCAWS